MTSTSTRSRAASRANRRNRGLAGIAAWFPPASKMAIRGIVAHFRSQACEYEGGTELARPDEDLLMASRQRAPAPLDLRDRWTSSLLGGAFLATAFTMAVVLSLAPISIAACGGDVRSRIRGRLARRVRGGDWVAVPTELLFVPMLFALPGPIIPLCVAGGYLLGASPDYAIGRVHPQRALVLLCSCWYAVGPILVLSLPGGGPPRASAWPIYLAALEAQFGLDLASSAAREWFAFGNSPRSLFPIFAWVYAVDTLLAPIGLLASLAGGQMEFAFLLALPLVGLLAC
jgi:hypothetical protein